MSINGKSLNRSAINNGISPIKNIAEISAVLDDSLASFSATVVIQAEISATLEDSLALFNVSLGNAVSLQGQLADDVPSFNALATVFGSIDTQLEDAQADFAVWHVPPIYAGISTHLDNATADFSATRYAIVADGIVTGIISGRGILLGTIASTLTAQAINPIGYVGVALTAQVNRLETISVSLQGQAGSTTHVGTVSSAVFAETYRLGTISTDGQYGGGITGNVGTPIIVTAPPAGTDYVPGSVGGSTHNWSVVATVGRASLDLTGSVHIDAEENGARSASLTAIGQPSILPGQRVVISLSVDTASTRLYSGLIQRMEYSPDKNETAINCTDQLQQYVDALTNSQIDAITPGAVTAPGSTETGYSYLTSRLSTVPKSAFLRRDGTFIINDWQASNTPKQPVDRPLYQSVKYLRNRPDPAGTTSTPTKRQEYRITVNLSWIRIARISISNTWDSGLDECAYLAGIPMPMPSVIQQAANNTGWDVDQLNIGTLGLKSGWVQCGTSSPTGLLVADGFEQPATRASWRMSKRFSRSMSATITWRVIDGSSDPTAPVQVNEQSITIRDPRDGQAWVDKGIGTLSGYVDANGDEYADLVDVGDQTGQIGTALDTARQAIVNLQQQVAYQVAIAGVRLMRNRRGETMSCSTIIRPDLDLGDTVSIDHQKVSKTGVISRLSHELDIDSGTATTDVQISIYTASTNGDSNAPAPAAAADYPANWSHVVPTSGGNWIGGTLGTLDLGSIHTRIATTPADNVEPPNSVPKTYIGGRSDTVMPESDSWQGWVANVIQSAITNDGRAPNFYPDYQATGFFIRVPPINLPTDQTTPINAGERLIVI